MLVITTAVEKVALGWGTPEQRWVDRLTLAEAKAYLAEGPTSPRGAWPRRSRRASTTWKRGGGEVLITDPASTCPGAIRGETGTRIVP